MPTLVVKRLVTPGHEKEYEQSIENLIQSVEHMDGYMGINIARPIDKAHPLYIFSAKFDTAKNLQHFKESDVRRKCLKELQAISQAPIKERTIDRLDWWFALPGVHYDIPRYKMVVVTTIAAYPVVLALNLLIDPSQAILPLVLRTLIAVVITISAISYITMPLFLNVFRKWLNADSVPIKS